MLGDARGDRQTTPRTRETVAQPLVLSPRQKRALAVLLERKTLTRKEYQQFVDQKLPARTANYDLNDMMGKGILVRIGAGSNTRYNLSPSMDIEALQRILDY